MNCQCKMFLVVFHLDRKQKSQDMCGQEKMKYIRNLVHFYYSK
jgi:hypothetical protein